ncbi:MAG: nucleoside triphosphate pyrophosphohydrolase [Myxococcales bacterium]|nr:nucleoside triphosphate pyrophosphohydrolase [Myxococcales bacterium]MCB9756124.1 nucleoside triphosphate pyrophosphohydrolase [Myxococcales bacterium]
MTDADARESAPARDVEDHRPHGLRDGLAGLRDLMDRLLGDAGCPWDREQSLESLRPYLLEEAHEVLDALDRGSPDAHRRELGDLLFQIVFQSALQERAGHFDMDGVIEGIRSKMIRRHPHVFAPEGRDAPRPSTPAEVDALWRASKARERASADAPADPLAGIPRSLPALRRATRLQDRAATVGFDWPDADGPRAKIEEELRELDEAVARGDLDGAREELGDLLFVIVRYASKLGLDAEDSTHSTCAKFESRFGHVMRRCWAQGLDPRRDALSLEQLDALWDEAKALERRRS